MARRRSSSRPTRKRGRTASGSCSPRFGAASPRALSPGRRNARVFQRLNEPTRLLAIGEWASQAAYESLRQSPELVRRTATCGPPPTIEYLERLHLFARFNERPAIVACVTIDATADRSGEAEAFMRGPSQREVVTQPGLVSRELYRSTAPATRLLSVHGWRSLDDLERFRTTVEPRLDSELHARGATVSRFTGEIVVEYSLQDLPTGT